MAELRNGLRAGDIWVEGSRRYRSLDDDLVPLEQALESLHPESDIALGPRPFVAAHRQRLEDALCEVEHLAAAGTLTDGGIKDDRLSVALFRRARPRRR